MSVESVPNPEGSYIPTSLSVFVYADIHYPERPALLQQRLVMVRLRDEPIPKIDRTVVWFSCGITSAVSAKLAVQLRENVVVAYCNPGAEHEDNVRFLSDVEQWIGQDILRLKSTDYKDSWDVFEKRRYLNGPKGALCTVELKKKLRQKFQRCRTDEQVFGFDFSEQKRARNFRNDNREVITWFPLIERKLTKNDCKAIIRKAGIAIPTMYRLGYRNNNCIGCVKGQAGYWNKIRRDFPEVFERMAKLERELDAACCKTYEGKKRVRIFLDELDPEAGNYKAEPDTGCGIACGETLNELDQCDT